MRVRNSVNLEGLTCLSVFMVYCVISWPLNDDSVVLGNGLGFNTWGQSKDWWCKSSRYLFSFSPVSLSVCLSVNAFIVCAQTWHRDSRINVFTSSCSQLPLPLSYRFYTIYSQNVNQQTNKYEGESNLYRLLKSFYWRARKGFSCPSLSVEWL